MGDIAIFRTDVWPPYCHEQLVLRQEDLKVESWSPVPINSKIWTFLAQLPSGCRNDLGVQTLF